MKEVWTPDQSTPASLCQVSPTQLEEDEKFVLKTAFEGRSYEACEHVVAYLLIGDESNGYGGDNLDVVGHESLQHTWWVDAKALHWFAQSASIS